MVPSRDGLVVAADSRTTVVGINCDSQFKILEPRLLNRTIATVTGVGVILDAPSRPVPLAEICQHVRNGARLLDIEAVVLGYLNSFTAAIIIATDIDELIHRCINAIHDAQVKLSSTLEPYRGREMFSVVIARYDPATRVASSQGFVIGINQQLQAVEIRRFGNHIQPGDYQDYWAFGETEYLNQNVLGGIGRQYLSPAIIRFYTVRRVVRDVTVEDAQSFAVDLIHATARTTALAPAPSGIGGAIDVVLLGADGQKHLQWKSR